MKTDSLFYKLFQTAPTLLFELIGQPSWSPNMYDFCSIELKQTAFRIDGIFIPTQQNADAPVYFVEVQFQRDDRLYSRLFAEVMLFLRQNPSVEEWRIVVIYGDRSCEQENPGAHSRLLDDGYVQQLYLNELAQRDEESIQLGLVRLVMATPDKAIDMAKQLTEKAKRMVPSDEISDIIELLETILVYKFPSINWQEIRNMFGISELRQTRVFQEGEIAIILKLLKRRFGSLPEPIPVQVDQLSVDLLEELAEDLFDFSTLEDLRQWLQMHQNQN